MRQAKTLIQLRSKLGWSQDALAKKLGVSRRTVARWETGDIPKRSIIQLQDLAEKQALADEWAQFQDMLLDFQDFEPSFKPRNLQLAISHILSAEKVLTQYEIQRRPIMLQVVRSYLNYAVANLRGGLSSGIAVGADSNAMIDEIENLIQEEEAGLNDRDNVQTEQRDMVVPDRKRKGRKRPKG